MSLVPAVTELLLAELMYLQYDNPTKPIFMYINSAGVQVGHEYRRAGTTSCRCLKVILMWVCSGKHAKGVGSVVGWSDYQANAQHREQGRSDVL